MPRWIIYDVNENFIEEFNSESEMNERLRELMNDDELTEGLTVVRAAQSYRVETDVKLTDLGKAE